MTLRRIAFGGIEVEQCLDSYVVLIGRNFETDLCKGDVFHLTYRSVPAAWSPDGWPTEFSRADERAISLKVESIWAYGHTFSWLSPGITARLELSGTGGQLLCAGNVLEGKTESIHSASVVLDSQV